MDAGERDRFTEQWGRFFPGVDLPIVFQYAGDPGGASLAKAPAQGHQCMVPLLAGPRKGAAVAFDVTGVGCSGGKRYLGFSREIMPHFEYFLSCGIPGQLEGERYKKSPELVREVVKRWPRFDAPDRFIVFKRWDRLKVGDDPAVVIFFAPPDVLAGLFTLANYDELEPAVLAPFCAGCASIVQFPYLEEKAERPKAFLGMFDVSARPYVPAQTLTFAAPMSKFRRMVENMQESFLITPSWGRVRARFGKQAPRGTGS
jgi:hypothetical protein